MDKLLLKLFIFSFVSVSLLTWFSFANKLTFSADVVTWKYFCPIDVEIKANYMQWHDTFTDCFYVVKYNTGSESLTWKNQWQDVQWHDREINNLWLLEVQENFKSEKNSTKVCSVLLLTWITPGASTTLSFVNKWWVLLSPNEWCSTCGLRLDHWNINTLTDASHELVMNYETCPCTLDWQNPLWRSLQRSDWKTNDLNWERLVWQLTVTWLVVDWLSTQKWWYWFSGNDTNVVTNYVSVPNSLVSKIDNQEWVDSGTIKVVIHYDDFYWVEDDIFSLAKNNLNISDYIWSNYWYPMTWNNNRRWYWINFTNTTGYQVERQVDMYVYAWDNWLNMWSVCTHKVNSGEIIHYTINQPTKPTIQWLNPTDWANGINPNATISMKLSDDWAWIDTGSLIVWVEYPIWSGDTDTWERVTIVKELSWDFFTWWMFELTGWSEWLWNAWSYVVTFSLTGLTTETGIKLSWYVEDLADNFQNSKISFETRQPCGVFGCRDTFEIRWFDENDWLNEIFSKWPIVIFVTWSNDITFTWEGNSELICGWSMSASLTWNIKMFDENWNIISNEIDITDMWDIYFLWLDVEYNNEELIIKD